MTENFFALPVSTQERIDAAFNYALADIDTDKLANEGQSYDYDSSTGGNARMPLSVVHLALGFLDLPQDDEDTLAVLRKAAKGWREDLSEGRAVDQVTDVDGSISREDWRAVCSVLMDDSHDDLMDPESPLTPLYHESMSEERQYGNEDEKVGDDDELQGGYVVEDATPEQDDDTHGGYIVEDNDSDNYQNSDEIYDVEAEDVYSGTESEYSERRGSSKVKPKGNKRQRIVGTPTSHQQQVALEAFALFFPSSEEAIADKKLTVKDLDRVAKSLKEDLKSDEMSQMIEWFSSSPDKALSFDDFTRIIVMAGLA